ncbi:protein of unknown function (DUF1772) domain containing protein [Naviculisporaceae sp. PSN 640]
MSSQPTPSTKTLLLIRALQGLTPLLTSFTTGLSLSLSVILVPRLLESPSPLMLRQWMATFDQGKKLIPSLCGVSALGYFTLSVWHFRFNSLQGYGSGFGGPRLGKIYLLAGLLTLGIVPYTRLVMWGTNLELMKKGREMNGASFGVASSKGKGKGKGKEVEEGESIAITEEQERGAKYLVDHWGLLNLGRAALVGAAAVLGLGAGYL